MDTPETETLRPARTAPKRDRYHHGALRAALLDAAAVELSDKGIEAFSLRGVARRAGVSHAAPAHHFTDANGLLTALAADGFRRFTAMRATRQAAAAADTVSQLVASGLGYVDFARAHPALFRLMFASDRPDFDVPALHDSAATAYQFLVDDVRRLHGSDADPVIVNRDVMTAWGLVHGIADLTTSGRMKPLQTMEPDLREDTLTDLLQAAFSALQRGSRD